VSTSICAVMADNKPTQFDDVYLNLSKHHGRLRLHTSGLGWKSSHHSSTDPYTVPASDIRRAIWSAASRGYALKILLRNGTAVFIDGFLETQAEKVAQAIKDHFGVVVENREHSLRGWNWGKAKFEGNELVFQVGARAGFEVPLTRVSNTNLVGKNEVAVEFNTGNTNNNNNNKDERGDELVEMRFYVPGMKEKDKDASDVENDDEEEGAGEEETTAASVFYPLILE
jgi:structure-specific recognition protein 1